MTVDIDYGYQGMRLNNDKHNTSTCECIFPAGSAAHYDTNTSITNLPLSYLQTETFTLNDEDL